MTQFSSLFSIVTKAFTGRLRSRQSSSHVQLSPQPPTSPGFAKGFRFVSENLLLAVALGIGIGGVLTMFVWLLFGGPSAPSASQLANPRMASGADVANLVLRTPTAYPRQVFLTSPASRAVFYRTSSSPTGSDVFSAPTAQELLAQTHALSTESTVDFQQRLKNDLTKLGFSWTPESFVSAARTGNTKALALFIKAGMPVNSTNAFGNSALYVAAEANQPEVVKMLLAAGADVNQPSSRRMTALHRAVDQNMPAMFELLLVAGAAVNAENADGWTPIFFTVSNNNIALFDRLVKEGANINHADVYGSSLLALAVRRGHMPLVKKLITLGVKLDTPDVTGQTILHVAVQTGNYQLTKMLLENGANPNLKMRNGSTPIDVALAQNNLAIANLLLAHGASRSQALGR